MQIPQFKSYDEFDTWLNDYCFVRNVQVAQFIVRLGDALDAAHIDQNAKPLFELLPEIVNSGKFVLPA